MASNDIRIGPNALMVSTTKEDQGATTVFRSVEFADLRSPVDGWFPIIGHFKKYVLNRFDQFHPSL